MEDLEAWMPARGGGRRRVLVVGGNWMDHGEPVLAAIASMYSGADEVILAVPNKLADAARCASPDVLVMPIPDQKLTKGAARWVLDHVPDLDAAYLGAGMKDAGGGAQLARELSSRGARLVLGHWLWDRESLGQVRGSHPLLVHEGGHFERELGAPSDAEGVRRVALELDLVALVEGQSWVASDGREVLTHPRGIRADPAGLLSVIGGIAAGLLALGMDGLRAAASAAAIAELAADSLSSRRGLHWGASALLEELPSIMARFDRVEVGGGGHEPKG